MFVYSAFMKQFAHKMLTRSILIFSLFSSLFASSVWVYGSQGMLWEMLDISGGREGFILENPGLESAQYYNSNIQTTYENFRVIDEALRAEFIMQYRAWQIDYYQMQDIIRAYNNFVYYTQKTFEYADMQSRGYDTPTTHRAIKNSYSQMRMSYIRVQTLLQ